ncbi:hypothetical protein EP7_003178 [Isosphaeraceae bacterium EP7]
MGLEGRKRLVGGMIWLCWGTLVTTGFAALIRHESSPGPAGPPLATQPGASDLALEPGRFNLVIFAHPRCPCTRATLAELAKLLARFDGRLVAQLHLYRPVGTPESWAEGALMDAATATPGLRIVGDEGGRLAAEFGSLTSGHSHLYGPDGARLFDGGITPGRAHEGDNEGASTIAGLIRGDGPRGASTPVYGCTIANRRGVADAR